MSEMSNGQAAAEPVTLSLPEFLQSLRRRGRLGSLIQEALVDKLLLTIARRAGLTVTDDELQQAADAIRCRAGLFHSADTGRWLAGRGMTAEDLEALAEQEALRRKLQAQVVAPEQVEAAFAAQSARFDRLRLAHLVVEREGLAGELLCRIKDEGHDFGEAARQHSLDERTRHGGGRLGWLERGKLHPALAAAVAEAGAGTVVGPVATEAGFHLLLVEEIVPAVLDEARRELLSAELFAAWLQEQIRHTDVRVEFLARAAGVTGDDRRPLPAEAPGR